MKDFLKYPLNHASCLHKLYKVVKIFTLLLYWLIVICFSSFPNKIGFFSHLHIISLPILLFTNHYLLFGWLYFCTIHSLPIRIYHISRQQVSFCLWHLSYPVDVYVRICWNDWLFIKARAWMWTRENQQVIWNCLSLQWLWVFVWSVKWFKPTKYFRW